MSWTKWRSLMSWSAEGTSDFRPETSSQRTTLCSKACTDFSVHDGQDAHDVADQCCYIHIFIHRSNRQIDKIDLAKSIWVLRSCLILCMCADDSVVRLVWSCRLFLGFDVLVACWLESFRCSRANVARWSLRVAWWSFMAGRMHLQRFRMQAGRSDKEEACIGKQDKSHAE